MAAMLEKDKFKFSILTTLFSEASQPGLNDGHRNSTDSEVIRVAKRFVLASKDNLELLKKGSGNEEHIARIEQELAILEPYIPSMMSTEELQTIISGFIEEAKVHSTPNIGMVMKYLRESHAGLYDGNDAKNIIVKLLQ